MKLVLIDVFVHMVMWVRAWFQSCGLFVPIMRKAKMLYLLDFPAPAQAPVHLDPKEVERKERERREAPPSPRTGNGGGTAAPRAGAQGQRDQGQESGGTQEGNCAQRSKRATAPTTLFRCQIREGCKSS